ncbi:MerR family transcriptional regulator [Gehongia tenuis]|uniref:MerR family transcriptional regulator n=1 Tax=Gehongia tenuis TaxID=2763655 RepID=A0A926D3Z5_9FIRM|nr:MerR family transcriptional regulator [Gehongia tenuis]MBC8530474.1 MerR family transcriptional regulator [Gehongia tenuis]
MMTVKEAARLSGVSVRTLRHYDEIGLLRPAARSEAGYRLYGEEELRRLQQILFFRELGFSLAGIRAILDDPAFDEKEALLRQRQLLRLEKKRLEGLIRLTERALKGERTMDFTAFDGSEMKEARDAYAAEVREKYGHTEAYRISEEKAKSYGKADWARIEAGMKAIFGRAAAAMDGGPDSPAAQGAVSAWQDFITENFYPCTKEILAGLGELYTADPRFRANLEGHGPGFAEFFAKAIDIHCKN